MPESNPVSPSVAKRSRGPLLLVAAACLSMLAACSKPSGEPAVRDGGKVRDGGNLECVESNDCIFGECVALRCVSCEEAPCGEGKTCSNVDGKCFVAPPCDAGCSAPSDASVAPTSCKTRLDCTAPLVCRGGACLPPDPTGSCATTNDCPLRTLCRFGSCTPGCETAADCKSATHGPRCDAAREQCGPCVVNGDCEAGESCLSGKCEKVTTCSDRSTCGDKACLGGVCKDCGSPADCGAGFDCTQGKCVAGKACTDRSVCGDQACLFGLCKDCTAAADCGAGFDCTKGRCAKQSGCVDDQSCRTLSPGHFCNRASGACEWGCLPGPGSACGQNCCGTGQTCNTSTHRCEGTSTSTVLASLNPAAGPAGTAVQATGSGFGTSPSVTVGGVSAGVTSAAPTALGFTVPTLLAAGTYSVVVTGPSGASAPLPFTVTGTNPGTTARLVLIDPPGGLANQLVMLRGSSFGTGSAKPTVLFGATAASVVTATDASATVRVPAAAGMGPVQVTLTPAGGMVSNGVGFRIAAAGSRNPGLFTATGSLSVSRAGHTATVLQSGKVLVTGGDPSGGSGAQNTAEVYDPTTGTFASTAGTMAAPRQGHTATLLADGRVLVVGGFGNPGGGLSIFYDTEIYDPATNAFSPGPRMAIARSAHVAVPLASGDVLVAGGESVSAAGAPVLPTRVCEYYRFQAGGTGSFQAAPPLNLARLQSGALSTYGGAALFGGQDAQSELASAEILDQLRGSWTKGVGRAFVMTIPRVDPGVVRLSSGDVAVIGGFSPNGYAGLLGEDPMTTVDFLPTDPLNPSAGTFSIRRFPSLPPRVGHTTTLLADDRVLVVGSARTLAAAQSATVFDSAIFTGAQAAGTSSAARFQHTVSLLFNGRVLVCGGGGDASSIPGVAGISAVVTASCDLFDP